MLAAYGSGLLLGRPLLDYAAWIALWLNLPRVLLRQASAVNRGTEATFASGSLGEAWADALAGLDEEVEYLHYWINAERSTARARAKLGFTDS